MDHLLKFYNQATQKVHTLLEQEIDPRFEYHNLRHTLDVLEQAENIGAAENIDRSEMLLLKIAAIFHDTGFSVSRKNHEQHSVAIFLREVSTFQFSELEKNTVCACILATRMPQSPQSQLERILCDADLDYLGRDDFFEIGNALHREMLYAQEIAPDLHWDNLQIKFLENHRYKTDYSISVRAAGVADNLRILQQKMLSGT
jgi:predicted metal-dependent HD superfamily phosphohydrolase